MTLSEAITQRENEYNLQVGDLCTVEFSDNIDVGICKIKHIEAKGHCVFVNPDTEEIAVLCSLAFAHPIGKEKINLRYRDGQYYLEK